MSQDREPNLFSRKTKALVGLPLFVMAVALLSYDVELYIDIVGAMTLPIAVLFPLIYMTLPWKQTVLGRALMTKARAIALLYLVGITGAYLTLPFHGYLMAAIVTYLAAGLGFQLIVLLRIKARARAARIEREETHGAPAEEPA